MGEAEKQPWTKPLELKDEYGNENRISFRQKGISHQPCNKKKQVLVDKEDDDGEQTLGEQKPWTIQVSMG